MTKIKKRIIAVNVNRYRRALQKVGAVNIIEAIKSTPALGEYTVFEFDLPDGIAEKNIPYISSYPPEILSRLTFRPQARPASPQYPTNGK